jgi:hypothetical protein
MCPFLQSYFLAVRYPEVFALTRVCERNSESVVVAKAFANGRDDKLYDTLLSILLQFHPPGVLSHALHTTIRGPKLPMTKLQRMAGLWRAAQLMY